MAAAAKPGAWASFARAVAAGTLVAAMAIPTSRLALGRWPGEHVDEPDAGEELERRLQAELQNSFFKEWRAACFEPFAAAAGTPAPSQPESPSSSEAPIAVEGVQLHEGP